MILPFERDPSAPGADESCDSPRDVTITFGELPVPPQCDPEPGTKAWRSRLHRRDEIQLAADSALKRWRRLVNLVPNAPPVVRPLARAPRLGVSRVHDQHALPPPRREEVFKGGTVRTFQRVF